MPAKAGATAVIDDDKINPPVQITKQSVTLPPVKVSGQRAGPLALRWCQDGDLPLPPASDDGPGTGSLKIRQLAVHGSCHTKIKGRLHLREQVGLVEYDGGGSIYEHLFQNAPKDPQIR